MYLCDLKALDGLPFREGYYAGAPLCLLYVNGNDQLVPIAIQLKQKPGKDNPIFLPTDGRMDWLLAKIYYQSASLQVGHFEDVCVIQSGEINVANCFDGNTPCLKSTYIQVHERVHVLVCMYTL